MSSDKNPRAEPTHPAAIGLLQAAHAGDEAEMRRMTLDLLVEIDQAKPDAVASLDEAALALGRAHLLDDLRRALTPEVDARMTEVVRGRCCATVRAAWKFASYDIPNDQPLPADGGAHAAPPKISEGHPFFPKPPPTE